MKQYVKGRLTTDPDSFIEFFAMDSSVTLFLLIFVNIFGVIRKYTKLNWGLINSLNYQMDNLAPIPGFWLRISNIEPWNPWLRFEYSVHIVLIFEIQATDL